MRLVSNGLAGCLLLLGAMVHAEERTFQVFVDGKPAGVCRTTVSTEGDVETVTMTTDVKVRFLGFKYEYSSKSVEFWKGGVVQKLESTVNDDGKKLHVKAEAGEQGLTATSKGRSVICPKESIPSTGWRIPRLDIPKQTATVLDTEDGTATAVQIDFIGKWQSKLATQNIEGFRFKVTGKGIDNEWVYDAAGRPVRQTMKWDGHAIVLEITGIQK